MTALEIRDVSAGYGKVPVLKRVTLRVEPGEVVALLGANGAGKTTTLLTVAGEIRPSSGEVRINGAVAEGPLHRRAQAGLGYVPEERSILRRLTVLENLRLGGVDPNEAFELVPELERMGNRRAGLLSGGEQQMLTVARMLARRPSVLLADELSLGLAPRIVTRMLDCIRAAADDGVGVLLVEQHIEQALRYADRVYVMQRGVITAESTASEAARDRTLLEAAYFGA